MDNDREKVIADKLGCGTPITVKTGDTVIGYPDSCPLCESDNVDIEDDYQDRYFGNQVDDFTVTVTCHDCGKDTEIDVHIVETFTIGEIRDNGEKGDN